MSNDPLGLLGGNKSETGDDPLGLIGTSPSPSSITAPVDTQKEPGFLDRVSAKLRERGSNIYDLTQTGTSVEKVGRVLGQELQIPFDIGMEGIKSAYHTLMPEKAKTFIEEPFKALVKTPLGREGIVALKNGGEKWESFRKENPNIAYDIEAVFNIGTAGVGGAIGRTAGKGAIQGARYAGEAVKDIGKAVGNVTEGILARKSGLDGINKIREATVKDTFQTAIKPAFVKGTPATIEENYYKDAANAVKKINENMPDLTIINKEGTKVSSITTVDEMKQAAWQTLPKIWEKIETKLAETKGTGIKADLAPISNELSNISQNVVLKDLAPDIAKYAEGMSKTFAERGSYTPGQMQEAIARYNKALDAYYNNPSYELANKAGVDAIIVNNMRKSLDDIVEKATGTGVQELKNDYKSIKTVIDDISRRARVEASKNPAGLIDFSNMYTAAHYARGIVALDPASIASATAVGFVKKHTKWLNNPNRKIKDMFDLESKLSNREKLLMKSPSKERMIAEGNAAKAEKIPFKSPLNSPGSVVEGKYTQPYRKTDWEQQTEGLTPSDVALKKARLLELREKKGKL